MNVEIKDIQNLEDDEVVGSYRATGVNEEGDNRNISLDQIKAFTAFNLAGALSSLPVYADNAAALADGLEVGSPYQNESGGIFITIEAQNTFFTAGVPGVISDNGNYEAFPMGQQHPDGSLIVTWKRSITHADKGPQMLARSTNGGATWVTEQVVVGSTSIESVAHSFFITDSGRQIISYQDDDNYLTQKFAYRDGVTGPFTASSTVWNYGTIGSPSPVKMQMAPNGVDIWFGYYTAPSTGACDVAFLKSSNGGQTWSQGPIITSNATDAYPNYKGNEFAWIWTNKPSDPTAWEGFAIIRPVSQFAPAQFLKTVNSGVTWTRDLTEDPGSFVDTAGVTQDGPFARCLCYYWADQGKSPFELIEVGGDIVMIKGERRTGSFGLRYTSATLANAQRNKFDDWERPVVQVGANYMATSEEDCGYPVSILIKKTQNDNNPDLFIMQYDRSATTPTPPSNKACKVTMVKITL